VANSIGPLCKGFLWHRESDSRGRVTGNAKVPHTTFSVRAPCDKSRIVGNPEVMAQSDKHD